MSLLSILWEQISFKDFVDILIVAIVIYQFMLIIKGTRAVQVILGLALLGTIFVVGISYNLYSLNWLLAHFFDSFFIIVIILFQDQIRSTLASLAGTGKIFGGISREKLEVEVDEFVEVIFALSKDRIGGLLVFERTNGLSNFIDTGTIVESKIHKDLIYAIFQSKSPIHDGALIVSGGFIKAVGCFLPLSKSLDVDRTMGTRHRAALGLSEVTDAVIIIISEETGRINLCVNGEFHECEKPSKLRLYLKHLWANNGLINNLLPELKQSSEN